MAIFLTGQSRIIVQGITGSEGRKHGTRMLAAGTRVVGGTNPRKAGQTIELGGTQLPVVGTVTDAMAATAANVSPVFLPPAGTKDRPIQALDRKTPVVVFITDSIAVNGHTWISG